MVRVESRLGSPLSHASVQQIISHVDPELDTFNGPVEIKEFAWFWPNWIRPKQRLMRSQADSAQKYINFILRNDYPYQVREYMGRHLWLEFCEYWAVNPDFDKALRYL